MYALRVVTATVSCSPLIASNIMSKKLASGSDAILLDVTTGTGAFMKTVDQSIELAQLMVCLLYTSISFSKNRAGEHPQTFPCPKIINNTSASFCNKKALHGILCGALFIRCV